ncbi:MAG: glycosyltransferase family 4 protein [Solirubrobacterales bacterium]
MAASALAKINALSSYVTPVAFMEDGFTQRIGSMLPQAIGRRVTTAARLRAYPPNVSPGEFRSAGAIAELVFFSSQRTSLGKPLRHRAMLARNTRVDRGAANQLTSSDRSLFCSNGCSERSLERASELGIATLLNYPIAHHAWARDILDEEAELVPSFAATLQYPSRDEPTIQKLDREIELADRVLGLSSFHVDTFVASGVPRDKLVIAPLGVDLELFRPQDAAVRDGVFRVVFVGQITQRKGISYLIDAFELANIPNSELVFIGRVVGSDGVWAKTPRLRHIPHLPRHALPAVYADASVFVMPSLVEGFCLTAVEALACGVPSIVTPNTFGDEVVRDGVEGWNVPIRNAEAIADKLCRLAEDSDLRTSMASAARLRAEAFSWDAFGEKVSAHLLEI